MKILLIEDNERLAERIVHKLHDEYTVDHFSHGEHALETLLRITYDVILLDLGLPDIPGIEVCKAIRKNRIDTPVLILTSSSAIKNRVELLDNGADDFMPKPFDAQELKARIRSLRRRGTKPLSSQKIVYKDLVIDVDQHRVERDGVEVMLRRKEFLILTYLIKNSGRILTRRMIIDHVWEVSSNSWLSTVDVHIKHLRDKVDKPFEEKYNKTANDLGYKVEAA